MDETGIPDFANTRPLDSYAEILMATEREADRRLADGVDYPIPPEAEEWLNGFEIDAEVRAVRGKNTNDGPSLEIVLEATIDSHVADLMSMIGKYGTRVRFRPYVTQQALPIPEGNK